MLYHAAIVMLLKLVSMSDAAQDNFHNEHLRRLSKTGKKSSEGGSKKGKKSGGDDIVVLPDASGCPVNLMEVMPSGKKGKKGDDVCSFESIVTFGDSLSDTGNFATLPLCKSLPPESNFCVDRNSDGPVVFDNIAQMLGLPPLTPAFDFSADFPFLTGGNNFAVTGAEAREGTSPDDLTFDVQVSSYTASVLGGAPATFDRLHTIFIGSNDIINALYLHLGVRLLGASEEVADAQAVSFIDAALAGIESQLGVLLNLESVCNVVVIGAPDFGESPRTTQLDDFYPGFDLRNKALEYDSIFNVQVDSMLNDLFKDAFDAKCAGTGAEFGITFFDTIAFLEEALEDSGLEFATSCNPRFTTTEAICEAVAGPLGLSQTHWPLSDDGSVVGCFIPVFPNVLLDCGCEEFAFFDELHSSATVNEIGAGGLKEHLDYLCEMAY